MVKEQLAADVFSIDNPGTIAALGFLAAGPWDESSLRDIREDTLDREIGRYLDRDDIIANVMGNFVSLTVTAPAATITSSIPSHKPITTPCSLSSLESNEQSFV